MTTIKKVQAIQAWDENKLAGRLVELVLRLPRAPLAGSPLPDRPGGYLLFAAGPIPELGLLQTGTAALYGGRCRSLRERQRRHLLTLEETGVDPSSIAVLGFPTVSGPSATYVEALLLDRCRPVWNRLGGFGCRTPGSRRAKQKTSNFDCIFPGRYWAQPPTLAEQATARLELGRLLVEPGSIVELWPALWMP
jgi:Eco29kI restriction endonuclease